MKNTLTIDTLQAAVGPLFSFSIPPGQITCLTGASGSGKSLLLRAIADLDPYQGVVWFNGQKSIDVPPALWRKNIGLLPPESFWWHDRLDAHFSTPEKARPYLERVGLPADALGWHMNRLSTGEKQRLAIVRLLANTPSALLLDEPTANLDPQTTLLVEALLQHYASSRQAPILWVSHDLRQVQSVAHTHLAIQENQLREIPS